MNKDWQKVTLDEICVLNQLSTGNKFCFDEIEYIDISSVGTGVLLELQKMLFKDAPSRAKRLVKNGSTILSTVRPNRRSFLYIKNPRPNVVVSTGFAVLDPLPEKILSRFLYYTVTNQSFTDYLTANAKGAAYPAVDTEIIKRAEVHLPTLPTQRRIAAILSAYDELIENNSRRIKILEEMARMIYQEWFVKFRFPGHEQAKFVESSLGMIPAGWEGVPFTSIADVLSGGTPKTTEPNFWDGQIPFFTPKDATNNFYLLDTEKNITELGLSKCNSKLYPKDTVFITARGTVGKLIMPGVSMAMNQSCYALVGKKQISQMFLFLLVDNSVDYLKKNTGGATFETIVVDTFRRFNVIKPTETLIKDFTKAIQPIFEGMLNLLRHNNILIKTRDMLLPKLISGEIDVSDLDIPIEER